MEIPREVLVAIIGAIPVLLAPLIGSSLQRRDLAERAQEVEVLGKRVQLIERLLALDKHLSDERRKLLQVELADIAQDVVAERRKERAAGGTVVERLSFVHRSLLLYELPTTRASVYRGFFWFFLSIGVVGGFSGALLPSKSGDSDWPFALIGGLLYIAIGLAFRGAAVRQHKRAQANAAKSVAVEP